MKELQALGDAVREKLGSGVGVLARELRGRQEHAARRRHRRSSRARRARRRADQGHRGGGRRTRRRQAAHGAGGNSRRVAVRATRSRARRSWCASALGSASDACAPGCASGSPAPPPRLVGAIDEALGARAMLRRGRSERRACASTRRTSCSRELLARADRRARVGARSAHGRRAGDLRVRGGEPRTRDRCGSRPTPRCALVRGRLAMTRRRETHHHGRHCASSPSSRRASASTSAPISSARSRWCARPCARAARCSSAATAAARPTRSTWRPSTSCATCATGARIRPSRSRPTRRCSPRRRTTSASSTSSRGRSRRSRSRATC